MSTPAAFPRAPGRTTAQRLGVRPGPAAGSSLARRRFRTARLAERASLLTPRTFPRILDAACDVFVARFTPCFLVSLALGFPILFLESLLPRASMEQSSFLLTLTASALPALLQVIPLVCVCALVAGTVQGRAVSVGESLALGVTRIPGMLVVTVLTELLSLFGFCLCIVPGLLLRWLFSVVPAVYVLERVNILRAIRRGVSLAAGGGPLLRWLGCIGVGWVMTMPFLWVQQALAFPPARRALEEVLDLRGVGFDLAVSALGAPLLAIGVAYAATVRTVFYVDQRTRREGLDLELRLAALRAGQAAPAEGAA